MWLLGAIVAAFACLSGSLRPTRPERSLALGIGLISLLVWALWPTERLWFAGHAEASRALLDGEALRQPVPWPQSPPPMRALAWLTGAVGGGQAALQFISALCGAVYVLGWAGCAERRRRGAGVGVAILLLLDPSRMVWSHAVYHVIQPAALVALAAWLLAERRPRLLAVATAGLLWALSFWFRPDHIASLFLLVGLIGLRLRALAVFLGVAGALALVAVTGGLTEDILGMHGWRLGAVPRAWVAALGSPVAFGVWAWLPVVALLLVAIRRGGRRSLPVVVGGLLCLAVVTSFLDLGPRHTLAFRGLAAVVLCLWAPRGSVLAVALLLLTQAVQVPGLWYTRDLPSPRGPAIGSSVLEQAAVEGCAILRNDPALHRGPPGLHVDPLELLDPLHAAVRWREHGGCVFWAENLAGRVWTESVQQPRGDRLRQLYRWQSLGSLLEGGETYAVHRLVDGVRPRLPLARAALGLLRPALGFGSDEELCVGWATRTCLGTVEPGEGSCIAERLNLCDQSRREQRERGDGRLLLRLPPDLRARMLACVEGGACEP